MRFKISRESFVRWYFILVALAPIGIVIAAPLAVVNRSRPKAHYLTIEQHPEHDVIESIIPVEILYVPRKSEWVQHQAW